MRGDLVYEKLGEIDPELLTDALPPAAVTPPLYQLGSNQPMRPPRGPRVRKVVLICACILLAGLLLAGGTVALSRAWEGFFEETTPEDHFGKELTYKGTVSIDGIGPLTGSDELEVMGDQLKAIFTAAAPVEDVCECLRDLSIQIGDTTLTYNRDHGCFRDGDTGLVYQLREQDKEYVNDLLTDLESVSNILSFAYEYDTLRHGDDFVFTLAWWEGYGSIYKIDKVYLRYDGEDTEYVTPEFFTVSDQESTYRIHIMDDAPYGKYTLVAQVRSVYTGRNIKMEIPSVPGAVEIVPFTSEPSYTFSWNSDRIIYSQGETILVDVAMTNNGDPILRWTKDSAILPEVSLRSVSNGKTYPMSREQEIDWSGQLACLDSGAASKGEFLLDLPSSMPVGVYDLVLSFEGHEQVFEKMIAVESSDSVHGFEVVPSFYPEDTRVSVTTVPNSGAGILNLKITHVGDTLYRYGYDDCLRPDSLRLYRHEDGANAPLYYVTHTEKVETMWALENEATISTTYMWDWVDAPIEPGSYDLQIVYRDKDGNVLLDLTLEGVLTVESP